MNMNANILKFIIFVLCFCGASFATTVKQAEQKIIYKYKQYEKFDFDEFSIEGNTSSPGDLSLIPRYQKKFKNKLPERDNFNPEMKRSVERVL